MGWSFGARGSREHGRTDDRVAAAAPGTHQVAQARAPLPQDSSHRTRRAGLCAPRPGARATTEEAILNSFTGETTEQKREQGEDYWVDPDLVQVEQSAKQRALKVREEFVKGKDNFQEERLRQEIVAPYKNNVIGVVTVSIGVVAVIVSMFPNLLELNVPDSIGSFPDTL